MWYESDSNFLRTVQYISFSPENTSNTRNASLFHLNPLQNSKIQFQTFTLCTQIEHSNHNRTTIVPQINLKSISNLSKNAVSSIIKSFDTPPQFPVQFFHLQTVLQSNNPPSELLFGLSRAGLENCDGQRPSVGTDYDRNRAVTSWKFRSVGPRVARLYFVRFGNGRPRADVTFLHRYVPRMYGFPTRGVFLGRDNVCECACCWNRNRDENGIRIIVNVTPFLCWSAGDRSHVSFRTFSHVYELEDLVEILCSSLSRFPPFPWNILIGI